MALFKKNSAPKEKKSALVVASGDVTASVSGADRSGILLRPRITEKATRGSEHGVYVFDVHADANAYTVADAISAHFKVAPIKVNIVQIPEKRVFVRGKRGVKAGGKKAYVYLKKGDKIEFA
jgi:large subunit ribosomal protein L23